MLNTLSLCSGIGGLDLGLERAGGIRIAGQAEIDPWCRSVLAARWPGTPLHDDIRTLPDWWASEPRPRIHLVAGGVPCQPHSEAGYQRGTADDRWLWPAFAAVLEAVEPPLVIIENVPGLIRTGLGDILRGLARLGFDAWWDSIPAAAFGAPHLRRRLWLLAAHPGRVTLAREPFTGPVTCHRGYDGSSWHVTGPAGADVADSAGWRLEGAESAGKDAQREAQAGKRRRPADAGGAPGTVADPVRAGLEDRRVEPRVNGEKFPAAFGGGDAGRTRPREPGVGRGFDGPASWLDGTWEAGIPRLCPAGISTAERTARLRGIGNAVVPEAGRYIGQRLLGCEPVFHCGS